MRHAALLGLALAMFVVRVAHAVEIEPNRPNNSVSAKLVPAR